MVHQGDGNPDDSSVGRRPHSSALLLRRQGATEGHVWVGQWDGTGPLREERRGEERGGEEKRGGKSRREERRENGKSGRGEEVERRQGENRADKRVTETVK